MFKPVNTNQASSPGTKNKDKRLYFSPITHYFNRGLFFLRLTNIYAWATTFVRVLINGLFAIDSSYYLS